MPKIIDLSNQVFGRWTVVNLVINDDREKKWNCVCACGNTGQISGNALKRGLSTSCGCYRYEVNSTAPGRSENGKRTPTYITWDNMIGRCTRPSQPDYDNYGGRGISVCDEWKKSFVKFKEDMGERPVGKTLDRKNNNGDYNKENCKWSSDIEQQNNKSNSIKIPHEGELLSVKEYSKKTGLTSSKIRNRINNGIPLDKLHLTPKEAGVI